MNASEDSLKVRNRYGFGVYPASGQVLSVRGVVIRDDQFACGGRVGDSREHLHRDVLEALSGILQKIGEAERRALSAFGLNRQYVIIKPLDMTKVPDPDTLRKISEAIRVLADCGLIFPTSD